MGTLSNLLNENKDLIENNLYLGFAKWDNLIKKIEEYEEIKIENEIKDEQIWTFLVGCGYAAAGKEGIDKISKLLTGSKKMVKANDKIWFEVLPLPPRKKEGNTHLDLAVGNITQRKETDSGIELSDNEDDWICFCEMKWDSDISTKVSFDLHRNQLIRVIENALSFQNEKDKYSKDIYVTLVTSEEYYNNENYSRLYQYKFIEYKNNPNYIFKDIERSNLDKNEYNSWKYPNNIKSQIDNLNLNWTTYNDLFESLPVSSISNELKSFWKHYNKNE